jgi:FkbM family methyltransferase
VYYALAGNIALNNCWNASARWSELGEAEGYLDVPEPDNLRPGSFGSLELRQRRNGEFIGQQVSYEAQDCVRTPMVNIDAMSFERLDFLKIDVEGMEEEVLRGASATIARCRPIVMAEVIKSDRNAIIATLKGGGYEVITEGMGINVLGIHQGDPSRKQIVNKAA